MVEASRTKPALIAQLKSHRTKWDQGQKPIPEAAGSGEESVWDYPRPPELRDTDFGTGILACRVVFNGTDIAWSDRVLRVCETAGAPVYYFPPEDVQRRFLVETTQTSLCEWKGQAAYFDLVDGDARSQQAAFTYPDPIDDLGMGYERITGWFGFYPGRVDCCVVGDEIVTPQPGEVYAGWVTSHIKGPIKGNPGTGHW